MRVKRPPEFLVNYGIKLKYSLHQPGEGTDWGLPGLGAVTWLLLNGGWGEDRTTAGDFIDRSMLMLDDDCEKSSNKRNIIKIKLFDCFKYL